VWAAGDVILRREVLNDGRAWVEIPVVVVRDEPELLATYIPEGTPFRFPDGDWPTPTGVHPWHGRKRWQGHGVLMLQRPGEAHAIWVFWHGPERAFRGWYVNLGMEGRRRARSARARGSLHARAGRGDLDRRAPRRRRARRGTPVVGRRVVCVGT
jgi:hypothetical protein